MSEIDTAPAAALVLRRTYNAPRERVFSAWTQPEIMRRWMCPADTTISEIAFEAQPVRRTGSSCLPATANDSSFAVRSASFALPSASR